MTLFDTFLKLCGLPGVSGDESAVSDCILHMLASISGVEYKIDPLGNILVHKSGAGRAKTRFMLSAHMDEVGFIITCVGEHGELNFSPVGGIDPRVVLGRRVKVGKNGLLGVIGTKPIHLQSPEERKTAPDFDGLSIDIGASFKTQALKYVSPGDTAVFDSGFVRFGDGLVKSKAIDDRIGCALLLEILKNPLPYDIVAAFTVQEEVGARGARAAAFSLAPSAAAVVEATTAADIPFVPAEKRLCSLGKGPVISFMDKRTVYDRGLYGLALDAAKENDIPCQPKLGIAGGNDAGAVHLSRGGIKPLAVSLPCRYLHSPSCSIKFSDAESTLELLEELCGRIPAKEPC